MGQFGALFLITSFRNVAYFAELLIPAALADWMQFGGVLCGSLLLLPFVWRHGGQPHPRLERQLLWAGAGLLLLAAGLVLAYPAGMLGLRLVVYPAALGLTVLATGVACLSAWRSRLGADLWIAVGLALIVVGGVHDFAFLAGRLAMESTYWMPYLTPLLLGIFSMQMLGRMLRAMDTAEQLSQALEQRVAQRTRELAAANEAKNRFIAVASHDLRQPLNAVGLLVGTLRERIRFPEVRALVDKIQASVDGMAALLQSLLDLSRLDAGNAPAHVEDVPLAGLLEAIRLGLEPLAQQRGLRLRFARTRAVVCTDRALLAGMLRNLVGNAIRYTPKGTVLVGVRRHGATACLQLIDTGLGIEPAEQAQVFNEFYRGSAADADHAPGAGLGLAIVKRSAEALGHRLTMRSVPGRGTLMQIELPLAEPDQAWASGGVASGTEADHRRIAGSFVVVVEDDAPAREALGLLLRQWGCHVLAAASAAQALTDLQGHLRSPDLLLCDFHLGNGPDGLRAIDGLRQVVGEAVPALLMTAELPAARRASEGRQDVLLLAKPVTPENLVRALSLCLGEATAGEPAGA